MIAQTHHGYFIQIPTEIIAALHLPEHTSFDCSLEGSVIRLSPVSGSIPASSVPPADSVRPITINCFGKFQMMFRNTPVPIGNKKAKELLSLLLCEHDHVVHKKKAAAMLWPASDPIQAMNSLYKLCQYLKHAGSPLSLLPLTIEKEYLSLDIRCINSDLTTFLQLTAKKGDDFPSCFVAAEALYTGPLLFDECYDWIAPYEAFFDIRYTDMLEDLVAYYSQTSNRKMAEYYQKKLL